MFSALRIAAIAALVLAPVGAFFYGSHVGAERERAKQTEQSLEDMERRGDNNEAVRQLDDDGLFCDILGRLPIAGCP